MAKIVIRNVTPTPRTAGGEAKELHVKQTGGGPAKEATLPPGGELEFEVGHGQKVTVSEAGGED